MQVPDPPDRSVALAIGLLVLLAPVMILVLTLSALILMGDLVLSGLTPVEFLELYFIDFALFAAFAYGLYLLMVRMVGSKLPTALEGNDTEEAGAEVLSRTQLTDEDEGKNVVTSDGLTLGMITEVQEGTPHVTSNPDAFEKVQAEFDWGDPDEESFPLETANIAEVTDDEVLLR